MMKNRMIFKDIHLWKEFIRKLLYPAILGSLIFDFTKFEANINYLLLGVSVIFYIVDYFYMTAVSRKYKAKEKPILPRQLCLDFFVAIMFMAIIYCINNSYYAWVLGFTLLIFISGWFYFKIKNETLSNVLFLSLIVISIIIIIIQILFENCCSCSSEKMIIWTYPLMVFLYGIISIVDYYDFSKKEKSCVAKNKTF